jgi:WD40 repeat protein
VYLVHRWKAHSDGINCVTFVPEINVIASCSFDCHVYIWNKDCEKIGSLVLGNDKFWKIKIDKSERMRLDREEATEEYE